MPKANTTSRLELAHLKRQLETRGKTSSNKPIHGAPSHESASSGILPQGRSRANSSNTEKNSGAAVAAGFSGAEEGGPTRFDYKFVFTNSAMKKEDRIFRSKIPSGGSGSGSGSILEREATLRSLVPNNSFLPYGVTIRNPHMFEEDQLAIIQRRQEIHNITTSKPGTAAGAAVPYDPAVVTGRGSSRRSGKKKSPAPRSSKLREPGLDVLASMLPKSEFAVPRIPNRYSTASSGGEGGGGGKQPQQQPTTKTSALATKPLVNYRNGRMHSSSAPDSRKFSSSSPTQARDSEFRQQLDAILGAEKEGQRESNWLRYRRGWGARKHVVEFKNPLVLSSSKDVIDKLSNTVHHLNQYEERLKHYMKSKNTMAHAGAALKQLRFKRSKTIAQLSRLSDPRSIASERIQKAMANPAVKSFFEEKAEYMASSSEGSKQSDNPLDRIPKVLPEYNKQSPRKSPLDGEKLESVIGKKILATNGQKKTLSTLLKAEDDSRMSPLQAAMIEGLELNKMSALLAHSSSSNNGARDSASGSSTPLRNVPPAETKRIPGNLAQVLHPLPSPSSSTGSRATVSIYRHGNNPPSLLDGATLLTPPNFLNATTGRHLFMDPAASHLGGTSPGNTTQESVVRRMYNDFQIHQDKIERELMKSRHGYPAQYSSRNNSKPKAIDPTIRRVAEFSRFMQKKAMTPRRRTVQSVRP